MSAVLQFPETAMNTRGPVIDDDEHLREVLCSILAAVGIEARDIVMPVDRQALESALCRLHERLAPPGADFAGGACWTFDTARWTLLAPNGRAAQLSLAEAQLIRCLFERQGEVASREDLLTALNRPQMESFRRNLDVTVSRLRKKVESLCRVRLPLAAARGQGYAFNATVEFVG